MDKIKEVCQIQVGEGFKARVDESGNILIEKEKFVLKEGDFFYCEVGNELIYGIFKCFSNNSIEDHCALFINVDNFFTEGTLTSINGAKNLRLATTKERGILLDRIKAERYFWNFTKKVLEEVYKPKDGDIIFSSDSVNSSISIFKCIEDDGIITYCDYIINTTTFWNITGNLRGFSSSILRKATSTEIATLFKVIKENKLKWNSDSRTFDKIFVPQDGDIITDEDGNILIFNRLDGLKVKYYAVLSVNSNDFSITDNREDTSYFGYITEANPRPATEAEKLVLFEQLKKKKDLVWNAETKTLDAIYIPKVGDVCIFWNLLSENAVIDILERVTSSSFLASKQGFYDKCIPYNEELYKKMIRYVKV